MYNKEVQDSRYHVGEESCLSKRAAGLAPGLDADSCYFIEVANKTVYQSTLTRAKNTLYNCRSMIKAGEFRGQQAMIKIVRFIYLYLRGNAATKPSSSQDPAKQAEDAVVSS